MVVLGIEIFDSRRQLDTSAIRPGIEVLSILVSVSPITTFFTISTVLSINALYMTTCNI